MKKPQNLLRILQIVLLSQNKKKAKKTGFEIIRPGIKEVRDRGYNLEIDELCIGFTFDEEGDFLGIFNWKE